MSYTRQPFYLDGVQGKLFCIYYSPSEVARSTVVVFSPFAEEMNKSRRMLSQQANLLAEHNVSVLLFDYFATGDSEGDFADATWDIWVRDIDVIFDYLLDKGIENINILALRMGALLTTAIHEKYHQNIDKVIYWQPFMNGELLMTQFYRLKLAADMLGQKSGLTLKDIKSQLQEGQHVEISGYSLNPELANGLSKVRLQDTSPEMLKNVNWVELVSAEEKPVPPGSQRVIDLLNEQGANINVDTVVGPQFWSAVELVDVPYLHDITTRVMLQ